MRENMLFTKEEYKRRVRKTKEMMDRSGMKMLLVMDPANMNYLTGYDGWSFYVHQGVIISLDMENPFWFGREQDANGAKLTSWLPDDGIYGYPDEYVQSRYTHTMCWVAFTSGEGCGGAVAQSHRSYWYGQTVSRRIFLRTELCAGLG